MQMKFLHLDAHTIPHAQTHMHESNGFFLVHRRICIIYCDGSSELHLMQI